MRTCVRMCMRACVRGCVCDMLSSLTAAKSTMPFVPYSKLYLYKTDHDWRPPLSLYNHFSMAENHLEHLYGPHRDVLSVELLDVLGETL